MPVRQVPSGASLALRFPNGAVTNIDAIEATGNERIIQTSDGAKWQMVPPAPKELPFPPADTAGAPTTYWIVKERVIEQQRA
jgi:hypothetical protein